MALFTCLLLVSCGLKSKNELPEKGKEVHVQEILIKQDTLYQKADINFYHLRYHDMNSETIDIKTFSDGKEAYCIYDYQHLKSTNDTLIIYKDSIIFNRTKLFLIKKKSFDSGGKPREIGKYLCEGFQFAVHLYIDKSKGLVLFRDGNAIDYIYDATGKKLRKIVDDGSPTTTDYANGFVYQDGVLQYFSNPEGYARKETDDNFTYIYQYKDHLGNVRLSYADIDGDNAVSTDEIIEEADYYPFGMQHERTENVVVSTNIAQKIKYQGQERQDELGLNWDSFKFRNYDYEIGRFFNVDPLAAEYPYNSVYAFQENKLGMGRELEGLEMISDCSKDGKSITVTMRVKPVNNLSTLRNADFNRIINARKSATEKALSGNTHEGQKVNVNIVFDDKATLVWDYTGSIDRDGKAVSPVMGDALARGYTSKIGDTQNNRTQVNIAGHFQIDGTGTYMQIPEEDSKLEEISHSGAHEDGHVTGLDHPGQEKDMELRKDTQPDNYQNLMNPRGKGTHLTAKQRSLIIRTIEAQQKQ